MRDAAMFELDLSLNLTDQRRVRAFSRASLDVVSYSFAPTASGGDATLAPPGSLVLYIASHHSDALQDIRKAASKNQPMPPSIASQLQTEYGPLAKLDRESIAQSVFDASVFFDVLYQGQPVLSGGSILPGTSLAVYPLPFTGGDINPDAFSVDYYSRPNTKDRLAAFAVSNAPHLTEYEKTIIERVPQDLRHLYVGGGLTVAYAPALVIAAFAATTITVCWYKRFGESHVADPPQDLLRPAPDIRDLVDIRMRALSGRA